MNNMNHVQHNEQARSKKKDNGFMLGLAAVLLVVLVCGGIYYAISGTGMQTASTTPAVMTGSSPSTVTHSDRDEPRTPAANEPITPTPTPAPMAPKTPPSR